MIRHYVQEVRELGLRGTAFRLSWELRTRFARGEAGAPASPDRLRLERLPFGGAGDVREILRPHLGDLERGALVARARDAVAGRIRCFGGWTGDYGQPVDWYKNPRSGARWPSQIHWAEAQRQPTTEHGDIKLTWEIGRFPHAFDLARASVWSPSEAGMFADTLAEQVADFDEVTPFGMGVHWASSQEIAFRLLAWLFAFGILRDHPAVAALEPRIARALHLGAVHTERHIDYAKHAVHNNHLLSEALFLLMAAVLLPPSDEGERWRREAMDVLTAQSERQFYPDGGYIQQSHNYHRLAIQVMVLASRFVAVDGRAVPAPWTDALRRSVAFLAAQQNPSDGRLPNYGFNDGALPMVLTSCHFSDFRPTLQAASLIVSGQRLYPHGLWDEEAAWLLGADTVRDATLSTRAQGASSFVYSGHHVLRHPEDPSTFCTFRCGSLQDRFSQMDMLHVDVWWRGHNVLVDPGSCQYNDDPALNAHFVGTSSHNTVTVDGHDQMHLHRRFKVLYWTKAELLRWSVSPGAQLAIGQHHGFEREVPGCIHRRAVLFLRPETWVVVDRLAGEGGHDIRLHWLGENFPHRREGEAVVLDTPDGPFGVRIYGEDGAPVELRCVSGESNPLEGWHSRIYAEKVPALSMSVTRNTRFPTTFISVLGDGVLSPSETLGHYVLETARAKHHLRVQDGFIATEALS